jgi:hypothetical protein
MNLKKQEDILAAMHQVISEHGPWTAHNICLVDDLYTIGGGMQAEYPGLVDIIKDFIKEKLENIKVLDLGCLEGGHSITFARQGCSVLGIEGRASNIAKANFAKNCNNLDNVKFQLEDVRNLNCIKHGYFDVVICSGILYHLDTPDVFEFLQNVSACCTGIAYINTHFVIEDEHLKTDNFPNVQEIKTITYAGKNFKGAKYIEHPENLTEQEKEGNLWSSIGNNYSFWPTYDSLVDMIKFSGFSRVYRILDVAQSPNRCSFIAVK